MYVRSWHIASLSSFGPLSLLNGTEVVGDVLLPNVVGAASSRSHALSLGQTRRSTKPHGPRAVAPRGLQLSEKAASAHVAVSVRNLIRLHSNETKIQIN